jgi:amidohydrolase
VTAVKEGLLEEVRRRQAELIGLSHRIHAHPELGFAEELASTWVAELLSDGGLDVQRGAYDLPTCVVARAGSGPTSVVLCAEYDALPAMGHACGHNIIAAAAVGAGLALARYADDLGLTVTVLGTPAEEDGAGKALLLERGAFDGADAALMVHPAPVEAAHTTWLARSSMTVRFTGRAAHAASTPELGINAADALTVSQVAIGLLRQHLLPTDRVHGIVRHGGDAANVIPSATEGHWYHRAADADRLEELRRRVADCFAAGALATGCDLQIDDGPVYTHFRPDEHLLAMYRQNAEALGRRFDALPPGGGGGSTDMANVSLHLPAIHPLIAIDSLPAVNHQPEFAAATVTASGDLAALDGATLLAWTSADIAARPPRDVDGVSTLAAS